jgi:integrase
VSPVKLRHLHYRHGAYYYVRRQGGKVVWKRLSADRSEAIRLWETLERVTPSESRSVAAALDRYLQHRAAELAPATLELYAICRRRLVAAFAEFTDVALLKPKHVRQYLDARTAKKAANREVSLLSAALGYVMQAGWLDSNPCAGVDHNRERPRRRCYSDAEIAALRDAASDRLRCLIDLALLTALRQGDLLALRLSDLTDEGVVVQHRKTGARVVYQWTDALREAVGRAKRLRRRVGSLYLFADQNGAALKPGTVAAAWERLRTKAGVADAHFHDLRATSLTWAKEAEGIDYAQRLAGHASAKMTEQYVARRAAVKVRPIR